MKALYGMGQRRSRGLSGCKGRARAAVYPARRRRYNRAVTHEVEAKYYVESHEPIRDRLGQIAAEFLGAFLQTDRFYDRPDHRYRRSGCGLRLRSVELIEPGPGELDLRPLITFKGQIEAGALKRRREIQTRFDSLEAGLAMLPACGLIQTLITQKRRASWQVGPCTVELDELPLLGCFVEIEGPDEQAIEALAERLGIEGEHIARAYPDLLADRCRADGLDAEEIIFGRFG